MDQVAEQKQMLDQICLESNQLVSHNWELGECTGMRCSECGKVDGELMLMHMWLDGKCVNCGKDEELKSSL